MGNCKFTNELNRLRKSSSDSIDNVEKFDAFKEYMHVARTVEEDLKSILREINFSGKKSLVLLCGSAGDGKSHLLSYLKNSDEEKLISNYTVFNDATESSAPSMTAIETLSVLLKDFKDQNLSSPGKNIILAINLGVLSNFIESEYGDEFSLLRKYVAELLVKATIQDKVILTTREILNFIYDILVAQNFSFTKYQKLMVDDTAYLKEYLKHITPSLLFDSSDVTTLMNLVQKYDRMVTTMECSKNVGLTMIIMKMVESPLLWFRSAIWKH